jgi:hypothetical protein
MKGLSVFKSHLACSNITPVTDDSGDEVAAAKLWAVYMSEAEKYDRALVESWKSDMDGLLIFVSVQRCGQVLIRQIRFFRHRQVSSLLVYYGGAANPARFLMFDFPSISGIYSNLTVQVQGKVKWPRTSALRSAENCQINVREVYWPRLDNTDVRPLLRFFGLAGTKNIQPLIPPIKTGSRSHPAELAERGPRRCQLTPVFHLLPL